MPVSRASASSRMPNSPPEKPAALVCAPNWIGDSIMAMPALQLFRQEHADLHIVVLAKPAVAPLWRLHAAPNEVIELPPGAVDTFRAGLLLRRWHFESAWILPHSFRSALVPWLARIPRRIGYRGHARAFLLTHPVPLPFALQTMHQAWEYVHLFGLSVSPDVPLPLPQLEVPAEARKRASQLVDAQDHSYIVLLPGAARGPSKCWPAEHFVALGKKFIQHGFLVVVSGSPNERALCEDIAGQIGHDVRQLAGQTSLVEWAALLSNAQLVICNDSGGMHLAAAMGVPVIALYGITDPAKTGPLGTCCRVLQNSPVRNRDVPRHSSEAAKWLAAITPEQVFEEALKTLPAR